MHNFLYGLYSLGSSFESTRCFYLNRVDTPFPLFTPISPMKMNEIGDFTLPTAMKNYFLYCPMT